MIASATYGTLKVIVLNNENHKQSGTHEIFTYKYVKVKMNVSMIKRATKKGRHTAPSMNWGGKQNTPQ